MPALSNRNGYVAVAWTIVIVSFIGSRCDRARPPLAISDEGHDAAIFMCQHTIRRKGLHDFTVERARQLSSGGWHVVLGKGNTVVSCVSDMNQRLVGFTEGRR